jgi:TRAP-type uncharacterized transport system substrate-binding protein
MRALLRSFRRHQTSLVLALGLGLLALSGWLFLAPTYFRVGIPMHNSFESEVIVAYAEALKQQRKDVRLRVLKFADYAASSRALENGTVDLALVRPDILYPANGLTAAVMREEILIIIAPSKKKIDSLNKLAGKQLGMVIRNDADLAVLEAVLSHYTGITAEIKVVTLRRAELEGGGLGRRVDALAFIATPRSEDANRLVQTAVQAFGEDVATLSLEGLQPLSARNPALQEISLDAGAISHKPKLPNEELKTAGISYRLVAADVLDRIPVSKLVQHLFEMRPRVARSQPTVNLMKAPANDAEMSAALPIHRGAVDYFNREQQTFMDRWGDWLWLALFGAGGITSVLAWIRESFVRQRQDVIDKVLDRLVCMLSEARAAKTLAELSEMAGEIDGLVAHAVRQARWRTTPSRTTGSLIIALEGVRAAIADKRRELETKSPALVPEHSPMLDAGHELG